MLSGSKYFDVFEEADSHPEAEKFAEEIRIPTEVRYSGFRKILDAGRQQIREGRGIRHEDF